MNIFSVATLLVFHLSGHINASGGRPFLFGSVCGIGAVLLLSSDTAAAPVSLSKTGKIAGGGLGPVHGRYGH